MDYSMLVGLHFRETAGSGTVTPYGHSSGACTPTRNSDDGGPRLSGVDVDHLIVDPSRYGQSTYLGISLNLFNNFSFE